MIIKHHNVNKPQIEAPVGWSTGWHGNFRKIECKSEAARLKFHEAQDKAHSLHLLGERELEVDCFLSILQDINKPHITFMELGAGYAEWCIALDGVIKHKIVDVIPQSYYALAVEGEPLHYMWAAQHFEKNNVKGKALQVAVSDRRETVEFSIGNSADNYGQGIVGVDGFMRGLRSKLSSQTRLIECFTFDQLNTFEHVDLVHVDVQGAETKVIMGAMGSILAGKVDYWMIGTHKAMHNENIRGLLSPYYESIVDIDPRTIGGFNGINALCGDGVMIWKRK